MTDKRSTCVFLAVSAAHLILLTLFLASSGTVVPPVQLQSMQGVLVSKASREPATVSRQKEDVSVAKAPPEPSSPPPAPAKLPPSERAITVPQPKQQTVPASPPASVPANVPSTVPASEPVKDAQPAASQQKQENRGAQTPPRPSPAVERRAGANTSEESLVTPRVDAGHLNNPAPGYPSASRRLGEQGQVLLDVLILSDGSVGEIKVKRTSGFPRLDNAAVDAVRRWRYQPARRGNTPIAYWYVQPVQFSLAK